MLDQMSIEFMTAIGTLKKLDYFFAFLHQSHPDWVDMRNLSRNDIEGFLHFLRTEPMGGVPGGQKATNSHVNTAMGKLRVFIEDIQRYGWSESPLKPVGNLIYPEDYPKRQETNPNTVKYIPDYIWDLVLSNIDQFKREYIPILLVMEATGFRVSDVLMLKLDCLTKDKTGWWIIGDQRKVKYKDHRVPVTEEIAAVVQSQIELVRKVSTAENNPERYLFATFTGKRKGYPITSNTMRNNLNALARKCHILDENGRPYKFKNHAFRHRYGVTLLNNGMDIVIVQQLMAHASPEMTIVYAKILDETKRKEWEKVRATGAFAAIRISEQGKIVPATLEEQVTENGLELEWIRHNFDSIRLDHGICVKNPKIKCTFLDSVLEPPCIKNNCRSFHVDSTFIDYYKQQISKMEEDITAYKKANRLRSIELIEPKLKKYKEILSGLQNGNGIFGLEKSRREYTGDERERVATSVE
ncbi:tyrosine-type recombinase/integrase [Alicyclobacillus dauci]|uniref:Tyrosine-type recombinase/integrase n=1 Tax=Alicyclobacillus dauci TaxID=1475485 RepID=A0ABY6Z152_9BACL|nr:tyrosine-type recombinase/integrase [Alicyclobacillus dauci]WAH36412.1 tyrosine-type recombinase/integrase [Alicyclobacillus dauci]